VAGQEKPMRRLKDSCSAQLQRGPIPNPQSPIPLISIFLLNITKNLI